MQNNTNRKRITAVAKGLGELLIDMVFVGGATTELYIDVVVTVAEVRPTDDIDCIVQIGSRFEYAQLEDKLRKLGFVNDQQVICRWMYEGVTVDVMPTDRDILGFTNRWYQDGIVHAIPFSIDTDTIIQILSLPYFIACKLEALFSRGRKDIRLSKDFEDLVFLLHYHPTLPDELKGTKEVNAYVQNSFHTLLDLPELEEGIFCVLPAGENESEYVEMVIAQMKAIGE